MLTAVRSIFPPAECSTNSKRITLTFRKGEM